LSKLTDTIFNSPDILVGGLASDVGAGHTSLTQSEVQGTHWTQPEMQSPNRPQQQLMKWQSVFASLDQHLPGHEKSVDSTAHTVKE
jgi:hypothetical protein